jgi:hypothetical protein
MRLKVRHSDELGGTVATLSIDCLAVPCEGTDIATRSTADMVLDTDAYQTRNTLLAGESYHAYDGRLNASGFSFWLSNNEFWLGWCEAQVSRAIEIEGRTAYACGSSAIEDFGRRAVDSDGTYVLCNTNFGACRCNASNCTWNPYTAVTGFDLVPDGFMLRGSMKASSGEPLPVVFARSSEVAP